MPVSAVSKKMLGLFEIQRPKKLKRAGSLPDVDNDNIKSQERLFVRHTRTLQNSRDSRRYKSKSKTDLSEENTIKNVTKKPAATNGNVKKLAKQFETKSTENQVKKPTRNKTTGEKNDINLDDKNDVVFLENSKASNYNCSNKLVHRKKHIKSFHEAETDEEIDLYRQAVCEDMDKEINNMKSDGFFNDDDTHTNLENFNNAVFIGNENLHGFEIYQDIQSNSINYTGDNVNDDFSETEEIEFYKQTTCNTIESAFENIKLDGVGDEKDNNTVIYDEDNVERDQIDRKILLNSVDNRNDKIDSRGVNNDPYLQNGKVEEYLRYLENINNDLDFNEDFFENLETLYSDYFVVEAYNDDGHELIITTINRRVVHLDAIDDKEEEEIQNSHMVFKADGECLRNDIEEINTRGESGEPIYEDDEGIGSSYDNICHSVRRETFCDNQGNIRIERIGYPSQICENSEDNVSSPVSRSNSTKSNTRLNYVIEEIKSSEVKYVADLYKIVKQYKPYIMDHTPHMEHLHNDLFGNISKIFKQQKIFLNRIQACNDNVEAIGRAFVENEPLFNLYPEYLRNKIKADSVLRHFQPIVKQMQIYYNERLDFSAYLLTPLQRLGKYILLLENIRKEVGKMELHRKIKNIIEKALEMVKSVMSKGNDYVAIESIQSSPLSSTDYGSFIMRDKFMLLKPRKLECMVFLFTNLVVFTVEDPNSLELFTYYNSIQMTDLRIATFENGTVHLTDFAKIKGKLPNASRYTFILETKVDKIRSYWTETIEAMLWKQLLNEKANSLKSISPAVLKKLEIEPKRKSVGSSSFFIFDD